jgi:hypothetical protein
LGEGKCVSISGVKREIGMNQETESEAKRERERENEKKK